MQSAQFKPNDELPDRGTSEEFLQTGLQPQLAHLSRGVEATMRGNSIGTSLQSAVIRIGRRSGSDSVPPVWTSFLVFFEGVGPITEVIPWPTDNHGRSRQRESVLHQPAPGLAIPRHGALADR